MGVLVRGHQQRWASRGLPARHHPLSTEGLAPHRSGWREWGSTGLAFLEPLFKTPSLCLGLLVSFQTLMGCVTSGRMLPLSGPQYASV